MERTFLLAKTSLNVNRGRIIATSLVILLYSILFNGFGCDNSIYSEITYTSTTICSNPTFHIFIRGLYFLIFAVIFFLILVPYCGFNKNIDLSNHLRKNMDCKKELILINSLPINMIDNINSNFLNSIYYLLGFIVVFEGFNMLKSFRLFTWHSISLNTFSIYLVIASIIIISLLTLKFKSNLGNKIVFKISHITSLILYYTIIFMLFIMLMISQVLYQSFNNNNLFINFISSNNILIFIISAITSALILFLSYKKIIKGALKCER